jgi:WD40 repeat protein
MRNTAKLSLAALLLLPLLTTPANAQYFGRNKVQYEDFHFKTLRTEHFDIYYYDREADVVNDVGRMAERWYFRLSKTFNHTFTRKPIVLYANAADFHQTTTTGGLIGEGTGGFTDEFMNRVVLPLTGDYAENDHVLGHEIVHVFQYDMAAKMTQQRRRFNLEQMPLWLVEGMAEYFSKGRVDPLTSMWIRDATINDRLPDLKKLSRDPRYFPYRYGQALLAYIGGRFGDETVVRYFLAAGTVGIEAAFDRAVGISAKQLFADWQESARELYNPVIQVRANPQQPLIGKKPIPGKKGEKRRWSELNVGPALSPDGRTVAFLSSRELFDIELFLADAKTGQAIRHLVSSDRDAHFESLRFIESGGAFSPDGNRLAFITFARGDNLLSIIDINTRALENIKVPDLDAINNVAWSPDGESIAISGQITGVSDLFVYNLTSKIVRQLTNDKYADLQPAWSPDGRTIAFVTDRGAGPGLEQLRYDQMGIATINVAGGEPKMLPLFPNTKHINPQYGPDGSLYFIANPEGIPDVYRYQTDGTIARVTNVQTGVAGITDLSPALTVASKSGDIAYSLYEDDNYNLYTLPANPPGTPVTVTALPKDSVPRAAVLPPFRAQGSEITAYLQHPEQGLLAPNTQFQELPYRAGLHLAYLGPPTVGVGGSQYGYGVGGSVSAYFTDILGQQNVGFSFQGSGDSTTSLADQIGGEVFYLNQAKRFNWGIDTLRVPYVSSFWAYGVDNNTGNSIYQNDRLVETITDVSPLAQYPFGPTRRIEGSAGYQNYSYKQERETWIVDPSGQVVNRTRERLGSLGISLFKASTAFVGDSSIFGFVSPVRGTRYRYEVEALTGDIKFDTALVDWRKYFYRRPFTLAVRAFHYGRYGSGAEDVRLSPLYLGAGDLVRGYDPYGINPGLECGTGQGCPVFDRLVGSRVAAGSVELRAPLFGTPEFGLINASFLPTEIFAFGDIGAAWCGGSNSQLCGSDSKVTLKWQTSSSQRVPVTSVGGGVRILLSYIPIEFYVAKPFQRPNQSAVYGFNIVPGW